MRKTIFIAALALIACSSAAATEKDSKALDFTGKTSTGQLVKLSDYRGKVVLLDFWASWCGPCKKEFPFLVQLHRKLQDKNFVVLAINLDTDAVKMQDFLSKQKPGPAFPILVDPGGKLPVLYDVEGMPTTVLIDKKGIVRYRHLGFTAKDKKKLVQEVIDLLKS